MHTGPFLEDAQGQLCHGCGVVLDLLSPHASEPTMPRVTAPFPHPEKDGHSPGKLGQSLIGNWFHKGSWLTPSEQYTLQRTQYYHGTTHADRRWRTVEAQLSRAIATLTLSPDLKTMAAQTLKEYFSVRPTAGIPLASLCAGSLFIATREHRPQIPMAAARIGTAFRGRSNPVMLKWEVLAAVRHIHRTTRHHGTPPLDVRCILLHIAEHYPIPRDAIQQMQNLWNSARGRSEMHGLSDVYLVYVVMTHVLETRGFPELPRAILSTEHYTPGIVFRYLHTMRKVLDLPFPSRSTRKMEEKE